MLKSILFPIDASEASNYAGESAIHICKSFAAHKESVALTTLGVVDRPGIEKPEPTPMGGGGFKEKRDHALLEDARQKIGHALDTFKKRCNQADTDVEIKSQEGDPEELIQEAALLHDMIVIGKNTNFHFETTEETGLTVGRLVKGHPRPALITPTEPTEGQNVLLAYDGSIPCSHSIHFWVLLGLHHAGSEVHITSVDRDHQRAIGLCEEARLFLSRHGVKARVHPVESSDVVGSILNTAGKVSTGTIVMGAYGTGGLKAAFFGSTTKELYDASPYSLFMA